MTEEKDDLCQVGPGVGGGLGVVSSNNKSTLREKQI